jgi:SAM-dependent methyltransferase
VTIAAVNRLPDRIAVLIQLFKFNKVLPRSIVDSGLGRHITEDLLNSGLLIAEGRNIRSKYGIAAYKNCYFLHQYPSGAYDFVYLGDDSYILASHLPFNFKARNVLDLCSGTGIQAVLLAGSAEKLTGVELSPLAVNAARFNAILNNVEKKLTIIQGDLYAPVKNKKFDLIVSNPPFIPVPDNLRLPLCGSGGEDGLLVLRKIIANAGDYLTRRGICLLYGCTFGGGSVPFIYNYLEKIARKDKLDIDIVLLRSVTKRQEIMCRKQFLLADAQNPGVDPGVEMNKMYNKAKAKNIYSYILKLKKGKGNIQLISLIDKQNSLESKKNDAPARFLRVLYGQFEDSFKKGEYNRAVAIIKNIKKFCSLFSLNCSEVIPIRLGACYKNLGQQEKALIELRKAEKMNSGNAKINFMLAGCFKDLGDTERFNKELEKGFLKLKRRLNS